MRLFISYSRVDKPTIESEIVPILKAMGHIPWFDYELIAGRDFKEQLLEEITNCDALVYALSPESVASEWCLWEYKKASELNKPIIPILLRVRTKLPVGLEDVQYVDFSSGSNGKDRQFAVAKLSRSLSFHEQYPRISSSSSVFIHVSKEKVEEISEEPSGIPTQAPVGDKDSNTKSTYSRSGKPQNDRQPSNPLNSISDRHLKNSVSISHRTDNPAPSPNHVDKKEDAEKNSGRKPSPFGQRSYSDKTSKSNNISAKEYVASTSPQSGLNGLRSRFSTASNVGDSSRNANRFDTKEKHPQPIEDEDVIELVKWGAGIIFIVIIGILFLVNQFIRTPTIEDYLATGEAIESPDNKIVLYSTVIAANPDNIDIYFERANTYYSAKQFGQALEDYSKVILLNPNYAEAYYNRGSTYINLHNYDAALVDYNQAIEIDNNYWIAYRNRGLLYSEHFNNYENAIADYTVYIESEPRPYTNINADDFYVRGSMYLNMKLLPLARLDFTRSIQLDSTYPYPYKGLGDVEYQDRNYGLAIDNYCQYESLVENIEPYIPDRIAEFGGCP